METLPVARFVVLVAALLSLPCAAKGDFVIDFDTEPLGNVLNVGDVLTNQYAAWGVTFSALENGSTVDSTLFNTGGPPFTGNAWLNAPATLDYATDILRIEFASPVMNVQWLTYNLMEIVTFSAYNASGNLLETVATSRSSESERPAFSVGGIMRIDGQVQVEGSAFCLMDNLSYAAIPEPSTMAMWSLFGMVALGHRWWRKRRR